MASWRNDREGGFSMSDESIPENKPAADKGSQSTVASARKVIEDTELVCAQETITEAESMGRFWNFFYLLIVR